MHTASSALRRAGVLLLVGCTTLTGLTPIHAHPARDRVTVTFWTPLGDPLGRSLIEPYFRTFEHSHPGITVKFVPVPQTNSGGSTWVKYTTAMAAGGGPDLILTTSYNDPIPEWAANGLIQPLDTWFNQLHVSQNQFLPWIWQMEHFHGHVWGVVQEYDTALFVWNKDAFKAAGLDPNRPPRTIAELDADAARLTKFDGTGKLVQAGFIPWLGQGGGVTPGYVGNDITGDPRFWPAMFGGRLYDQEHRVYTIDNAANVRALDWLGHWAKTLHGLETADALVNKFSGNNDPFYTGQVAMEVVGDWMPLFAFKPNGPKNLNYGVAAPPTAPGVPYGTNVIVGSDTFAIPQGAQHPKEAAELMLYMMGSDPVLKWCIGESNMPPTQTAALSSQFVSTLPFMSSAVDTARRARSTPGLLDPFPSSSVWGYAGTQLDTAMQQVEYGRVSAQAALSAAQHQVLQRVATVKQQSPSWYAVGD